MEETRQMIEKTEGTDTAYISRVFLDGRKRGTIQAMYNPQIFHGALESSFLEEKERMRLMQPENSDAPDRMHPLWRVDQIGNRLYMLIVSSKAPNLTSFQEQFGADDVAPQVKEYGPFLAHGFENEDVMRFQFTGNPTVKKEKKRVPLNMVPTKNYSYCATDWAMDRIQKAGAEVLDVRVVSYENKVARGKHPNGEDRNASFVAATFEGILKITDKEKFAEALRKGIGHEKAFGCGMISVMKV